MPNAQIVLHGARTNYDDTKQPYEVTQIIDLSIQVAKTTTLDVRTSSYATIQIDSSGTSRLSKPQFTLS